LLVYALIEIVRHNLRVPSYMKSFVAVNAIGCVVHAAVLWLWVRNWTRVPLLPPGKRIALVVICWAMPLSFVFVFARAIR
jgi:hypothetical protein